MSQLKSFAFLAKQLSATPILEEKIAILNREKSVQAINETNCFLSEFFRENSLEGELVLKQMAVIGQVIFVQTQEKKRWKELVESLIVIDRFYREIGGIIGYQAEILRLLKETPRSTKRIYHAPVFDDISEETPATLQAIQWGLEALPFMGELYALGGAADRLHLVDEGTGLELPAAKLPFAGHTLFETLIRDLQAREELYFKRFGKRLETPIAIMTSQEKNNHRHVLEICETNGWFGRTPSSFRFFIQPLVPTVDEEGNWHTSGDLKLLLKPGGHGAIWKLAKDEGIFQWLEERGRSHALVRQINNPIAGLDHGLLAFSGIGWRKNMSFGFASCPRRIAAAEGMNVLVEQEGGEIALTNVEYCDFAKFGIEDKPLRQGEPFSQFSSNTNILFANLKALEQVIERCPFPGLLVNLKKGTFLNETGSLKEAFLARLESTMQNIADALAEPKQGDVPFQTKNTFVTYNHRHKTISVAKKAYLPGQALQETPELCFYELLLANQDLLSQCGFELPSKNSVEDYLAHGPSALFLYHPALGPLYSLIRQKLQRGMLHQGSELSLEIADAEISQLSVSGSLRIQAERVLGSKAVGRCILNNVSVFNQGIDWSQSAPFWKMNLHRLESLQIVLKGHSEFDARSVAFTGAQKFVVEDGFRMIVREEKGQKIIHQEPIGS
ncbi:MAG TPA: UTP--glucose-1-phosphate uridylyltransferase [Chlamydiales bacterium]